MPGRYWKRMQAIARDACYCGFSRQYQGLTLSTYGWRISSTAVRKASFSEGVPMEMRMNPGRQ